MVFRNLLFREGTPTLVTTVSFWRTTSYRSAFNTKFQVEIKASRLLGRVPTYEDAQYMPNGLVRPSAAFITAVLADEHGPLGIPLDTHCAEVDTGGATWESWLKFAPKYKDIGPTTQIALTVWEVREGREPSPLGGTTLRLFSKKKRLKTGLHTLTLWQAKCADPAWPSSTPGKPPFAERGQAGRIERVLKKYQRGEFQALPWLDTLSVRAARGVLAKEAEKLAVDQLQLVVEIPPFPLPVLYEDAVVPTDQFFVAGLGREAGRSETSEFGDLHQVLASGSGQIILIHDPEVGKENPAEAKAQKLARSSRRGQVDSTLRPNTLEKARINAVLASPPGRPLLPEDRELLWRFRYALVSDGRALTSFLKSVDWADAIETAQAMELMSCWAKISIADALELLSPDFPIEIVRSHAVSALQLTSDEELLQFLLQLVQALRYEPPPCAESRLSKFLILRSRQSPSVASALYWYLCAELDDPTFGERAATVQGILLSKKQDFPSIVPPDCIPLQMALIARLRHLADAARAVRSADRKTEMVRGLLAPGGACFDLTRFECPCPLDPSIKLLGLVPSECFVFKSKLSPMKLTFRIQLSGSEVTSSGHLHSETGEGGSASFMTKLASLSLSDSIKHSQVDGEQPMGTDTLSYEREAYEMQTKTLSLIFKRGDDVRQDQLVLQLIALMDRLLKREHMDLRMTAYQVLPTSADAGLIEFVPHSHPFSSVLRDHGSVLRFLTRWHPDPRGEYGLDPEVLTNYVRSCAGCTVVTHVLGIGDRHMDNIMLTTDGRLFHIDFGYFLGRDPKFSTAPLVLNRAMVDGMGGPDSPHYRQFVQLCGEAFNILRKSANLLLSLIHLMAGSSIPDIRSDPEKALLKVQERLRLDLDDENAAAMIEQLLTAAQSAVLPRFAEVQHRVAQGWR